MPVKIFEIIDEAVYLNYRYNRLRSPDITPEEWAGIFPNGLTMEQRFQQEKLCQK